MEHQSFDVKDQTVKSLWVTFQISPAMPGGAGHWAFREDHWPVLQVPTQAWLISNLWRPIGKFKLGNHLDIRLGSGLDSSGSQGGFLGL